MICDAMLEPSNLITLNEKKLKCGWNLCVRWKANNFFGLVMRLFHLQFHISSIFSSLRKWTKWSSHSYENQYQIHKHLNIHTQFFFVFKSPNLSWYFLCTTKEKCSNLFRVNRLRDIPNGIETFEKTEIFVQFQDLTGNFDIVWSWELPKQLDSVSQ